VQPRHRAAQAGGLDRYVAADLDNFLVKLGVRSPVGYKKRLRNVPAAAKHCCRSRRRIPTISSSTERSILEGRPASMTGYLSVLVDPDEAAKALRGAENGGVPLREGAPPDRDIGRRAGRLIAQGHIASFVATNPVNRCPQRVVAPGLARVRMECTFRCPTGFPNSGRPLSIAKCSTM
jgi:hypothetical protein